MLLLLKKLTSCVHCIKACQTVLGILIHVTALPPCVETLHNALSALKMQLAAESRTARLWIQYLDYIQILKDFIRADRTCDWPLHLASLRKMLNLFAATGHRHYAKSVRLYLQEMADLPQTRPWLHEQLSKGLFALRRTDLFWAGLSTDLVIEQMMMRSAKSRGGLTRGRGMTESVRTMWVKSSSQVKSI
jgi:hypothetical protein